MELCKRVVRGLEASPTQPLAALYKVVARDEEAEVLALADGAEEPQPRPLGLDDDFVRGHGAWWLDHLRSFDAGATKGELKVTGCDAVQELAQQRLMLRVEGKET